MPLFLVTRVLIRKLLLTREHYLDTGIFGILFDRNAEVDLSKDRFFASIEHSYDLKPKIPEGSYICVRGIHRLHHNVTFETFEITKVPGRNGCLFHPGNKESDSEGCVLIGLYQKGAYIYESVEAFNEFMESLNGENQFQLDIIKGERE